MTEALLGLENISVRFPVRRGVFRRPASLQAVSEVSFALAPGEILGLVGESGSGKTTIGLCALGLAEPASGRVLFRSEDIAFLSRGALAKFRRAAQPIFQDPYASLDPRMSVGEIIAEPLAIHRLAPTRAARRARVAALMEEVGLAPALARRLPHQLSGGQRQRVGIARALASDPVLLVADEPVSALDVSIAAQVTNLLIALQRRRHLAMILIAHDLALVGYAADRVIVLYLGRIMEIAPARRIFAAPRHPYTQALLAAIPEGEGRRILLEGDIPSPLAPPSGCVFRTRCRYAEEACAAERPALRELAAGHFAACRRAEDPIVREVR
ncbi:MAG TPA: oligopeptide/dipeptide ABC transporter ATP-binding protein [Acetobacteraceae bacterium]|nr:oligopeptide/dipeptide ABC transporter ATP-binding protein [Acetobacteraceae bacterium]